MTPDQLRAKAQEHDRAGERAIEEGDAQRAVAEFRSAEICREVAAELERQPRRPLRGSRKVGTLSTEMEAAQPTRGAKVSQAKTKAGTLFQAKLHELNLSIPQWVERQHASGRKGITVEAARSWVKKPGKGGRPVPRPWADRLAVELEAPALALPDSWPNGIRG